MAARRSDSGKAKKAKGKPAKQAVTSPARAENGQLLPGHTANPNGRPKGFDFRKAVTDKAEEDGTDLEQALYDVFSSMMTEAKAGDVAAARFVADRLCGMLKQEHSVEGTLAVPQGPPIPEGMAWTSYLDRCLEVSRNGTKDGDGSR